MKFIKILTARLINWCYCSSEKAPKEKGELNKLLPTIEIENSHKFESNFCEK